MLMSKEMLILSNQQRTNGEKHRGQSGNQPGQDRSTMRIMQGRLPVMDNLIQTLKGLQI